MSKHTPETVAEWRRLHKPGRLPWLPADDELRAFVDANITRMTFREMADLIVATFGEARRVGKSALQWYWSQNKRRLRDAGAAVDGSSDP